jgi:NAD(P)-dependent dehydrogenase (short-subunit alcohol dehydrogenase family)
MYRSNRSAAEEASAAIPGSRIYEADIADASAVDDAIARIRSELGPIGILVNNAFRSGRSPVKTHELEVSAWNEDLATNLSGQFYVTRACLPSMVDQSFGRIVFIGSFAMRGEQGRVAYSVAKQGLAGLSSTIAQEYARNGITSNVVSPGFIETGAFMRLSEEIRSRAVAMVPSRRAGSPASVAALIAYLCSEDGGFTTGQVIGVDGGAR